MNKRYESEENTNLGQTHITENFKRDSNGSYQKDIYNTLQSNLDKVIMNWRKEPRSKRTRNTRSPQFKFKSMYSPLSSINEGKEISKRR